ncbi:MAG: hypothetical protein JSV51_06915 [Candidatus Bathyarchaeota archaeon]|nr:MAG: hypothetical protein JSV51_06915 [Candidatus Bathyarchaeota archaeon]
MYRKQNKKIVTKITILLWFLTTLALITNPLTLPSASATSQTQLAIINPTSGDGNFTFYTNTTRVGYTFFANVSVTNVTGLNGWQVNITWNPSYLELLDITVPTDHVLAGLGAFLPTAKTIDNADGWVLWAAAVLSGSFTGNGTVVQLEFNITAAPSPGGTFSSSIHIVMPGEASFFTKLETSLAFTPSDGQYEYISSEETMLAHLYVNPERTVNSSLTPCHNFTVDIDIANVMNLYSFNFTLTFNSTILNATSVDLGSFFPANVTPTIIINYTAGTIQFSAALTPPEPARTGNGTLATIAFHVLELGATNLTLTDTILQDQFSGPITHDVANGYFNNMLVAKLAVDPEEIIDPTLIPPKTFEINITLDDVEAVCAYEFTLSYDPEILACIGIIFLDALNETYYTPDFVANNTEGFTWVNVSYYPPSQPLQTMEPVALLTLIFRVESMGATPLDLHDTYLFDCQGNSISHEAHDGFFLAIIRDIAVINVTTSTTIAYEGWTVEINVTLKNEGNVSETFQVEAYYDNNLIGTINVVAPLAPDTEITVTFVWDTTGVEPCHNYTIKAEAIPVPYEIDTADNVFIDGGVKIKLMGDINGDGIVDVTDIWIAIDAFGSDPGHPRWNPDADFNQDGIIDITDITIAIINFGNHC